MNKLAILTAAVLAASPALASKGPNMHMRAQACDMVAECIQAARELQAKVIQAEHQVEQKHGGVSGTPCLDADRNPLQCE